MAGRRAFMTLAARFICMAATGMAYAGHGTAAVDDYPRRPVRFIVPLAPGGGSDIVARMLTLEIATGLLSLWLCRAGERQSSRERAVWRESRGEHHPYSVQERWTGNDRSLVRGSAAHGDEHGDNPAQVRAGKAKALAITSARRSALAPELPTVAEAGIPALNTRLGTACSPRHARRAIWCRGYIAM
jgi:hypothetical protein